MLVCLFVSNLFSLKWHRRHRDLHSFPTRRSSDLMVDFSIYNRPEGDDSLADIDYIGHGRDGGYADYQVVPAENRSEEHTSELQSRENLVCRLLLEKKKKIKRSVMTDVDNLEFIVL